MQNKCIKFLLQLDKMAKTCVNEFLELNWLNVHDKYLRFIVSDIFKSYNDQCPDNFNNVFCPVEDNGVATCCKKQLYFFANTSMTSMTHKVLKYCRRRIGITHM